MVSFGRLRPHMPPMLMNQEPISVQFYCSLGMLGWKMFDIWRTWPNIAFLSTLLLSSDWGFDYFWLKKKKKIATNCASALSGAQIVCIFCYLFIVVVDDNDGDLFFLLMLYMIIYESMNINKVLDYKGRALGAATFFVRFEQFPWIFFFLLPPCEVHLCTYFFPS